MVSALHSGTAMRVVLLLVPVVVGQERCSIEISIDGSPQVLETSVPPPDRDKLVEVAEAFARTHKLGAGAGCDSTQCVAGRLADQLAARCAVDEYRTRSTREQRCVALGDQRVCADLAPTLLGTFSGSVVAHCQIGLARTFPAVARSIYEHTVKPLGRGDVFFVLGSPQASRATALEWRAAFDHFSVAQLLVADGTGQLQKLQLCFAHVEAAETAAGRRYDAIVRNRPDLRWERAVPASLISRTSVTYCYAFVGVCPRTYVDSSWPCDVPDSPNATTANGHPATPACAPTFQFSMARSAPAQERAERHLYKGSERARHLAAAFEDLGDELCGNLQGKRFSG